MTFVETCRKIAEEKQRGKYEGAWIDLYTASAVIRVYDALNEVNKAKIDACDYRKVVAVAWKMVK